MKRIDHAAALALALMTGLAAADEGSRRVVPSPSERDGDRPSEASAELGPLPFDSLTSARYRQTALDPAKAVATDDAAAFRALHTDAGWAQTDDWWQSMLAMHKQECGKGAR